MIRSHLITAAVAAFLAALAAWYFQVDHYEAKLLTLRLQHAQAMAEAHQKAQDATIKMQRTKDEAIAKAEARAAQNAAAAAAARRTVDGLRDTLYSFRASLPSLSQSAAAVAADTAAELLGACAARYSDVAAAADRHASDALTLIEAWPKTAD